MSELVLHPTSTAQWHSLVSEAEAAAHCQLDETLESYLVFTLMRFCQRPDLAGSVMALEFLEGLQKTGLAQHDSLRDVGDKCLLVSGLFPQTARRRQVSVTYFVDLGRSAYQQLHEKAHSVYGQLAEDFVPMMDVLLALRGLDPNAEQLNLLESYHLWEKSNSEQALKRVQEQVPEQSFLIKNEYSDTSH